MAGSNQTYNSSVSLNLGQVPEEIKDNVLYQELLDLHDAIEALANALEILKLRVDAEHP